MYNSVAKFARSVNKSAKMRDRKNDYSRKTKHKNEE